MGLKVEIQEAMKAAMKAGDRLTVSTLRLLLSALQNEEIKSRRELTTEEIHRTIATLRKQRIEAVELFRKGGRADLASLQFGRVIVNDPTGGGGMFRLPVDAVDAIDVLPNP